MPWVPTQFHITPLGARTGTSREDHTAAAIGCGQWFPSMCQAPRGGELLRALSPGWPPSPAYFPPIWPVFSIPTHPTPCLPLPTPFLLLLQMSPQGYPGCWPRPRCGALCVAAGPSTCARPVGLSLHGSQQSCSSLLPCWHCPVPPAHLAPVRKHCSSQSCFSEPPSPLFFPLRAFCLAHLSATGVVSSPPGLSPWGLGRVKTQRKAEALYLGLKLTKEHACAPYNQEQTQAVVATLVAISHLSDNFLTQRWGGQQGSFRTSQKPQLRPPLQEGTSAEGAAAANHGPQGTSASGCVGLGMHGTRETQERKAWRDGI